MHDCKQYRKKEKIRWDAYIDDRKKRIHERSSFSNNLNCCENLNESKITFLKDMNLWIFNIWIAIFCHSWLLGLFNEPIVITGSYVAQIK